MDFFSYCNEMRRIISNVFLKMQKQYLFIEDYEKKRIEDPYEIAIQMCVILFHVAQVLINISSIIYV
jgi:hypothetical protein